MSLNWLSIFAMVWRSHCVVQSLCNILFSLVHRVSRLGFVDCVLVM